MPSIATNASITKTYTVYYYGVFRGEKSETFTEFWEAREFAQSKDRAIMCDSMGGKTRYLNGIAQ
jgi:hypothetical protein